MRRLSKTLVREERVWFGAWFDRMSFEMATACLKDEGPEMQYDYCVVSLAQAIQNAVVQWFDKVCGENGI